MPVPVNILRYFAAALLVLSVPMGCRGLSSNKTTPTEAPRFIENATVSDQPPPLILGTQAPTPGTPVTVYKPPVFGDEPIPSSAFRPIVPKTIREETVTVRPVESPAPLPSVSKSEIDAANRRVEELEKALAESEARARKAEEAAQKVAVLPQAPPPPAPLPVVTTTEVAKTAKPAKTPAKPPRKTPKLNVPGVTVSSEGDAIRFAVTDKTLFEPGTNRINPKGEETLRKIVAEIRATDPNASLEIEGHTDSLNTDPGNPMQKHDASTLKSVAVMEYFVKSLLWNHKNIRTSGHGASRPVGDNGTPEGRNLNNRVEIVMLP